MSIHSKKNRIQYLQQYNSFKRTINEERGSAMSERKCEKCGERIADPSRPCLVCIKEHNDDNTRNMLRPSLGMFVLFLATYLVALFYNAEMVREILTILCIGGIVFFFWVMRGRCKNCGKFFAYQLEKIEIRTAIHKEDSNSTREIEKRLTHTKGHEMAFVCKDCGSIKKGS